MWKSSCSCLFFKDFAKAELFFSYIYIWNSGTATFKKQLLFYCIEIWMFLKWKVESLGQKKPRFSFWLKINFRKMVSNKQDDLGKIDIILKIYRQIKQRASFRKPSKNFKIIDGHLAYKGKRRVMFDNDREFLRPQYHSVLT